MLGEFFKTHAASVAVHAGAFLALALLVPAAKRAFVSSPETITFELRDAPTPEAPRPTVVVPAPVEPAPTPAPRPARVPERARVVETEKPRPFQEAAVDTDQGQDAPDDVQAVPTPTTPLPELSMTSTTVGSAAEYVTTSDTRGNMGVRAGSGAPGGSGAGRGAAGPLANQGTANLKVSADWQVTRMPEPLNDREFEPRYPTPALRERREAVVVVRLFIDEDGKVVDVKLLEPAGFGFDAAAVEYAHKLRFSPARSGSNKVAARIDWSVHFYARN